MKKFEQDDFVGAGFKRVEHFPAHPPNIIWGDVYKLWPEDQRLRYAEKLAAAQNFAAHKIQQERDELQILCAKKEERITALEEEAKQNATTLQSEIVTMNEERQEHNAAIAALNSEIRELKNGNNT